MCAPFREGAYLTLPSAEASPDHRATGRPGSRPLRECPEPPGKTMEWMPAALSTPDQVPARFR